MSRWWLNFLVATLGYSQFSDHGFQSVRRSDRYWAGLSTDLAVEQVLMRSLKSRGGLTHGCGFAENVRLSWIYTVHQCASVHVAMTQLTGLQQTSSDQHVQMGKSRAQRDTADLTKILQWLEAHSPFTRCDPALTSLSTGLTAEDDGINCDLAEEIGEMTGDGPTRQSRPRSVLIDRQKQSSSLIFTDMNL